jgi:hypothetical protein
MSLMKVVGMQFAMMLISMLLLPETAQAETTKVKGEFYEITVETSTAQGKQKVTITAKGTGGYKCNKKYPWKLTIEPAAANGEKTVLKKKDAKKLAEDEVVFVVESQAGADGKTKGQLKLSMCDEKQCKMAKVDLTW